MSPRLTTLLGSLAIATAAVVGCGAGTKPAPEVAPREEATPAPSSASGAESAADAPETLDAPSSDAPPPPTSAPGAAFDLDEWAYQHRMKVDLVADGCEPAELGSAPGDVIWCGHHVEQSQVVLYTRALYAARQKRLVKLVEVPVAVGLIDPPEGPRPESERYRVRLAITRAADGKRVELREAPGYDCDRARKENEEDKASQPALYKELGPALSRVCAQRGAWTWTGSSLSHTGR